MTGKIQPPRAGSLLHRTVQAIGRSIVRGEFASGVILPVEDELSARFGVGRNVVREAVKILGEKRLLRTERRIGTLALPSAEWNHLDAEIIAWTLEGSGRDALVDDLTALRTIIEPEAARLAALHATATETLRLFEAVDGMERAASEHRDLVESDILFHQRLFEATHNRLLLSLVRTVSAVLHANFSLAIKVEHDVPLYLSEHRAVAEAIRRRDPQAARAIMEALLANNAHDLAEMRHRDLALRISSGRKRLTETGH